MPNNVSRFGFKLRGSVNNFGHLIAEDGTDLAYTLLPAHLRRMGFRTHLVGKWHQGYYAPHFLPTRRGFDTFFGFLGGCEDHVTQQPCGTNRCERQHRDAGQSRRFKVIDLWRNERPATGEAGVNSSGTALFLHEAVRIVTEHGSEHTDTRLFLLMALQDVHSPYQVEHEYLRPLRQHEVLPEPQRSWMARH